MRFIHLSDLHLGKSINGVSLIDNQDQVVWVERFLDICREKKPAAVCIAGDVYDRSTPGKEAVQLFDHMLTELSNQEIPVLMVAGNHDSGEKLAFASEILARQNVHISGTLNRELDCVTLKDEECGGEVHFWMMPYLFPSLVAQKLEDDSLRGYEEAVRALLEAQNLDSSVRNVLIAHQNVTASGKEVERGGSESMVGGVGQIDYQVFDEFDYVALGHIHAAYPVGRPEVRYAGSPLYYHFDELRQAEKGPLLVTIGEKGTTVQTEVLAIKPLHPMRELKGTWEVVKKEMETNPATGEYLKIVVTDSRITPQISEFLRSIAEKRNSVLMELLSDYREFAQVKSSQDSAGMREKAVEELFAEYYTERRVNEAPSDEEMGILKEAGEMTRKAIIAGKTAPDQKDVNLLLQFILGQED